MTTQQRSAVGAAPWTDAFEAVAMAVCAAVAERGGATGRTVHLPPVLERSVLERGGYLESFPDLAAGVAGFAGNDADHARLIAAGDADPWAAALVLTDLVLTPAACYVVYDMHAGRLSAEPVHAAVLARCFRQEPSADPMRMRSFRMYEHVLLGSREQAREHADRWLAVGGDLLAGWGLDTEAVAATDPFFGRAGRLSTAFQERHGSKSERVWPRDDGPPVALMSVNRHLDHFGRAFGITRPGGAVAESACAAFGVERIALALVRRHGPDPTAWPSAVRSRLAL